MPPSPRPERDILNYGLDIFRDAVRPYIIDLLGEDNIKQFLKEKPEHNGKEPQPDEEIDIGDFATLVWKYRVWFPHGIRFGSTRSRNTLDVLHYIRRQRNDAAHPKTKDMDKVAVRACLDDMIWFLAQAGQEQAKEDIIDLRRNGTPLEQERTRREQLEQDCQKLRREQKDARQKLIQALEQERQKLRREQDKTLKQERKEAHQKLIQALEQERQKLRREQEEALKQERKDARQKLIQALTQALEQERDELSTLQTQESTQQNEVTVLRRKWAGMALPEQKEPESRRSSPPPSNTPASQIAEQMDNEWPERQKQTSASPALLVQGPSGEEMLKQPVIPGLKVCRPTEDLGNLSIFNASVFAGLSASDLACIQSQLHIATFGSGDLIYDRGALLERLFLLQEGFVRIEADEPTAPQYQQSGHALGLGFLMSGKPSRERVTASSDVRMITLERTVLLQLSAEIPRFGINLWRAAIPSVVAQWLASPVRAEQIADTSLQTSPKLPASDNGIGDAQPLVPTSPVAPLQTANGQPPVDTDIWSADPVAMPEMADDPFLSPDPPRQRPKRFLARLSPFRNMTPGGKIRTVLTGLALLWLLQAALRYGIGI